MNKQYKFCKANGCWWLVVDNIDVLTEFYDKTGGRYAHAAMYGINESKPEHSNLYKAAETLAQSRGISIADAMASISGDSFRSKVNMIASGEILWLNEVGGWNLGLEKEKIATVHRSSLLFPNYTKTDIKISRWPGGRHYYAKVGEIEVRDVVDGEVVLKWDSYEDAYAKALAYCIS